MSDYYYYIAHNGTQIGVMDDEGAFYTGNLKMWYTKTDSTLSLDTSSPLFDSRYHMVLVWGALTLMGFDKYERNLYQEIKRARANRDGRKTGVIRQWDY